MTVLRFGIGGLRFGRLLQRPGIHSLDRRGLLGLQLGRPQHGGKPAGPGEKLLGSLRCK